MSSDICVTGWSETDDEVVRAFVNCHPAGLVYYTPQFRDFLRRVTGSTCRSKLAWSGGRLRGVLPLHQVEGAYGVVLNSLPFFGSYGGVLSDDPGSASALLAAYEHEVSRAEVCSATWIDNPFDVAAGKPRGDLTDRRIAQWTELPAAGDILNLIDSSARRNVKKANASGIVVSEQPDAMDFLEDVHRQNMANIGGQSKPHDFFVAVAETMQYGRDWRLYVAEHDGRKCAALLTFEAAKTVEYVTPAILDDARTLQPTAAILAYAMSETASRGMLRWNWGGTWLTQDGVYRFKKKWGASEREYQYYIKLNDPRLLQKHPEQLTESYGYFYTVPFHALKTGASA